MAEFFDFNPHTGIRRFTEYDNETGLMKVIAQQDVEPLLDHTKAAANEGMTDHGIKNDWWLYCKIPPIVQLQLMKKGINIHSKDPAMRKRMFEEINREYPYLKTTHKHHGRG
jgi:hypothetical protein